MTRLPTLFLSHGSPMTAVEPGAAGQAWAALAGALPVPRAVLMVSAHWDTELPMLSGNAKPETIHDFGGFPDALYALRYPAPGAPDVAQEKLTDAGLKVEFTYNNMGGTGVVAGQLPAAGAMVAPGTTIALEVDGDDPGAP